MYKAFKEYGVENFTVETILEGAFDSNELDEIESFYISKCNSLHPNGYNSTTGGKCGKRADEVKERQSKMFMGRDVTWGNKVSNGVKKLWEDPEYRKKQLLAKGKRGKYKRRIKPLRIDSPIDKIKEFYKQGISINKIAEHFGVGFCTIKRRINSD